MEKAWNVLCGHSCLHNLGLSHCESVMEPAVLQTEACDGACKTARTLNKDEDGDVMMVYEGKQEEEMELIPEDA